MKINSLAILSLLVGVTLAGVPWLPATDKTAVFAQVAVGKELEKLEADWAAAVETNKPAQIEPFFTDISCSSAPAAFCRIASNTWTISPRAN